MNASKKNSSPKMALITSTVENQFMISSVTCETRAFLDHLLSPYPLFRLVYYPLA